MQTNTQKSNGGGAMQNNANQPQKTLKNTKLFRPLVASSLALALSASIASAAVPCNGSNISLCLDGGDIRLSELNFNILSGSNTLSPQYSSSGTSTTIEYLNFDFIPSGSPTPTAKWYDNEKKYTISISRDKDRVLTLDSKGRGIKIGANGTGSLGMFFGQTGSDDKRHVILNLDGVDSNTYAFEGSFNIFAGKGVGADKEKNGKVEATFGGKGMKGNVVIDSGYGDHGDKTGFRTILNFKNKANLEGSVTTRAGTTIMTFNGGNIKGTIKAEDGVGLQSKATNRVIFTENGGIEGDIITKLKDVWYASSYSKNIISFQKSGYIRGNITSTLGENIITATNLTITRATTGSTNSSIMAIKQHRAGASNSITAKNLTINTDSISANGSSSDVPRTHNKILITGSGDIQVGQVVSASSMNTFSVSNGGYGSITIKDSLSTNYGANTFMAERGAIMFNLGANATITAQSSGQNRIVLKQGGKFLTANDKLTFQELFFDKVQFDEN